MIIKELITKFNKYNKNQRETFILKSGNNAPDPKVLLAKHDEQRERAERESAPSQKNIGYWFIDERPECDRKIICSNCDQPIFKYHKLDFDYRPNFCPNCGAKMREVEE